MARLSARDWVSARMRETTATGMAPRRKKRRCGRWPRRGGRRGCVPKATQRMDSYIFVTGGRPAMRMRAVKPAIWQEKAKAGEEPAERRSRDGWGGRGGKPRRGVGDPGPTEGMGSAGRRPRGRSSRWEAGTGDHLAQVFWRARDCGEEERWEVLREEGHRGGVRGPRGPEFTAGNQAAWRRRGSQ